MGVVPIAFHNPTRFSNNHLNPALFLSAHISITRATCLSLEERFAQKFTTSGIVQLRKARGSGLIPSS